MQFDPEAFGDAMGIVIREAIAPLAARIKALESASEAIKALDTLPALVSAAVAEAVKTMPAPRDGIDGKDADPVEVTQDMILDALKADPEFLKSIIAAYFAENPPPSGERGEKGDAGEKGAQGDRGEKGDVGIGIAGAMIDRDGNLNVTLSNGELKELGRVVGRDGEKGADGADGIGFDDLSAEYDGRRGITLRCVRGDKIKEWTWTIPALIDKGYWRNGDVCAAGDGVSHGGSYWIAIRSTTAKPCVENKDDWRLVVRKGRDGKDGRDGIDMVSPVSLFDGTKGNGYQPVGGDPNINPPPSKP